MKKDIEACCKINLPKCFDNKFRFVADIFFVSWINSGLYVCVLPLLSFVIVVVFVVDTVEVGGGGGGCVTRRPQCQFDAYCIVKDDLNTVL